MVNKKKNWIYYMQEGLKSMWKSKAVPNYRKDIDKEWTDNALDLGRISAFGKVNKRKIKKEYNKILQEKKKRGTGKSDDS
jgi:hypothetical protein